MHLLLSKLLQKRGVTKEDLSKEEQEWFKEKERVLSLNDEITVPDLNKFLKSQLALIEEQFKNLDNNPVKNERLILVHGVYSTILKAISASKLERQTLEDWLEQLIK